MANPLTLDYLRRRRDALAGQYSETSMVQRATGSALTLGTAFGAAFLQAKYPKLEKIGPVDSAAVLGGVALLASLFGGEIGLPTEGSEYVKDVADGLLSVYLVKLGAHLGDSSGAAGGSALSQVATATKGLPAHAPVGMAAPARQAAPRRW